MRVSSVAILTGICLLMAAPAYAYVDPGPGSLLTQLVIGGGAGLFVLGRLWWSRIKDRFGKKQPIR